jgi:hypothetical protein
VHHSFRFTVLFAGGTDAGGDVAAVGGKGECRDTREEFFRLSLHFAGIKSRGCSHLSYSFLPRFRHRGAYYTPPTVAPRSPSAATTRETDVDSLATVRRRAPPLPHHYSVPFRGEEGRREEEEEEQEGTETRQPLVSFKL